MRTFTPEMFEEQRKKFAAWLDLFYPKFREYGLYIDFREDNFTSSPSACSVSLRNRDESFAAEIYLFSELDQIELLCFYNAELDSHYFKVYSGNGLEEAGNILINNLSYLTTKKDNKIIVAQIPPGYEIFEDRCVSFDTWFESVYPKYQRYGLYIEKKTAGYRASPPSLYVALEVESENFLVSIELTPDLNQVKLIYNEGLELHQIYFPTENGEGLAKVHEVLLKEIPRLYNQPNPRVNPI